MPAGQRPDHRRPRIVGMLFGDMRKAEERQFRHDVELVDDAPRGDPELVEFSRKRGVADAGEAKVQMNGVVT